MRLVYEKDNRGEHPEGQEVKVGDEVCTFRGELCTVTHLHPPRHSASAGHVTVKFSESPGDTGYYYVSVIGAKWIDRTDRAGNFNWPQR